MSTQPRTGCCPPGPQAGCWPQINYHATGLEAGSSGSEVGSKDLGAASSSDNESLGPQEKQPRVPHMPGQARLKPLPAKPQGASSRPQPVRTVAPVGSAASPGASPKPPPKRRCVQCCLGRVQCCLVLQLAWCQ